jgi:hypothetical protein
VDQQKRVVKNARHRFERELFEDICSTFSDETKRRMDALLSRKDDTEEPGTGFHTLKSDPARPSLETVFRELAKLESIDHLELPPDLFRSVPAKMALI